MNGIAFFTPEQPEPRYVEMAAHDNGVVMRRWGEGTIGTVDGSFTAIVRERPFSTQALNKDANPGDLRVSDRHRFGRIAYA